VPEDEFNSDSTSPQLLPNVENLGMCCNWDFVNFYDSPVSDLSNYW